MLLRAYVQNVLAERCFVCKVYNMHVASLGGGVISGDELHVLFECVSYWFKYGKLVSRRYRRSAVPSTILCTCRRRYIVLRHCTAEGWRSGGWEWRQET